MIIFKYTLFSVIATFLNIATQYLSFSTYSGSAGIYVAMLLGTVVGFIVKYIFDKKFIFYYVSIDKLEETKTISLYLLMGVVTTLLFWGIELIFDTLIANANAKYFGAVVGLMIGYITKYFLDKKYVFKESLP